MRKKQDNSKPRGQEKCFFIVPPWFSGNDFPYKVRRAPAISDKCPPFHFFVHFLLIITQYCMNSYFLNSSECVPSL